MQGKVLSISDFDNEFWQWVTRIVWCWTLKVERWSASCVQVARLLTSEIYKFTNSKVEREVEGNLLVDKFEVRVLGHSFAWPHKI